MRPSGRSLLWGISGAAIVFALGAYGGAISAGERGSFVMNFPATGEAVGGPSPRALTGVVVVPLDDAGVIKRTLQPGVIEVASHVVTNVGDEPRRIRFEVEGLQGHLEWHSRDIAWNSVTHEIEREIPPGDSVDFGVTVTMPEPLPAGPVPLSGTILIVDAERGETLSELPVRFERDAASPGGDCCAQ